MAKGTNYKIVSITNPETEESVDVYVRYNWYHDPGVWTMPNGDPGYPEESEIEIREYHLSEAPTDPIPHWITEELLEDAIWNAGDVLYRDED